MICDKVSKKWIIILLVFAAMAAMLMSQHDNKRSAPEDLENEVPEAAVLEPESAALLRRLLIRLTYEECEVLNWARYEPVMPHTPILLVTVHRGLHSLRNLISALQQISEINTALLIFSHSYYDARINDLVRSIRFCKVMQIFYPYSVQAYPDQFPGVDPNDCAPNEEFPEGCVKRNARRAESKHHWWWSTHFVFESLEWSGHHRGMVVFLQEDSLVQSGLLRTLRIAERALTYFPSALLVLLEAKTQPLGLLRLEVVYGGAVLPAFNASAWRRLNSILFCTHDDSSWWYSLLATVRVSGGLAVHAGMGASLHSEIGDDSTDRLVWLWGRRAPPPPPPLPPGGFSDLRDQIFCLDPLINKPDTFTLSTDAFTSTYTTTVITTEKSTTWLLTEQHEI